ncbi:MAG: hypothetical protein J2P47_00205 [Acetobacteraceae bacterium]|nr:hypothetical protein [Acetobacteraceae bacterium]
MGFLSDADIARLTPAEMVGPLTPIPKRVVSSDEYVPAPQNARQREAERRMLALGDELAKMHGISRRRFFQTAAGLAAGFLAMNQTYGHIFDVTAAEAATPELAQARAESLAGQFIMDMHTHFLREDTRLNSFVRQREAVGEAGWNPELVNKPQTIEDLKFNNDFKEIFLDSDTKVALSSSSPSDIPEDWFLTNEMMAEAREKVNSKAGACSRMPFSRPGSRAGSMRSTMQSHCGLTALRATRSATTRTRRRAIIPGGWTMKSSSIPHMKRCSQRGSRSFASTRACFRHRSIGNFQICAATRMSDLPIARSQSRDWRPHSWGR